jgi:tetratricopeptide (TPR) repeat protein
MEALTSFVRGRWFPLIELGCVGVATIIWELGAASNYLPLLIALAPWVVRFAAGSNPFKGWGIDIALALFVVTAAFSAYLAYDQPAAIVKFWLLVAAVLLFYAFANQPKSNLGILAGLIGLVGVGFAVYYLLANDWGMYPSRIALFNRLGLSWIDLLPTIQGIHPNITAGIIAMTLPLLIGLAVNAWRDRKWLLFAGLCLGLLVSGMAFLLIASRHSLVAVGITVVIGLIWLASVYLADALHWKRGLVFGVILLLGLLTGVVFTASNPDLTQRINSLPVAGDYTVNRYVVTQGVLSLIGDYPYSGAGLESFPGQFSTYYLLTPNYIIPHSYNLFTDVALEQSILAALSLVWVLLISIFLLLVYGKKLALPLATLRWAVLASYSVVIVHSFFDDILYDYRQAPLLLLLPGMAFALAAPGLARAYRRGRTRLRRQVYTGAAVTILAMLLVGLINYRLILADWYANRGALEMARVELSEWDWDNSSWKYGNPVEDFQTAEEMFERALAYEPGNKIANYRLGLISLLRQNNPAAVAYLTKAYVRDPRDRGVIKALGLSYVWNGRFELARPLLEQIPESREEVGVYRWFWGTQGREDLASNADKYLSILNPNTTQ